MSAEENAGGVICTVTFAKRPDGGMRVFSQDLPGLVLSHSDPDKVAADVWPAVKMLIERGATRRTPAAPMEAVAWGSCKTCNSERPSSPCWKCGNVVNPVAAGWEWPGLNDICRIRELAREVGYAVGVHGSMQRDQDLIAVPWVADAVDPLALAQHIAAGLGGQVMDYQTQDKPCGRWSCNIHTPDWTKLIDLSVMPPAHPHNPTPCPAICGRRLRP